MESRSRALLSFFLGTLLALASLGAASAPLGTSSPQRECVYETDPDYPNPCPSGMNDKNCKDFRDEFEREYRCCECYPAEAKAPAKMQFVAPGGELCRQGEYRDRCPSNMQRVKCRTIRDKNGATVGYCCRCKSPDEVQSRQAEPTPEPDRTEEPTPREGEEDAGDRDRNWLLPGIVLGAAALAAVSHHVKQEREQDRGDDAEGVRRLLRDGPQLPSQFNMSAFGVRGLIKGGWPVVVDYEQTEPGRVQLQISIPGADVVTYRLDQFGLGRRVLRFALPSFLGGKLKPAIVALTAADAHRQKDTIEGFRIHGIGIGPRAVGSVAVNELEFAPDIVRAAEGDHAAYSFHSLSDFDNAAVEFMRITQSPDGFRARYVNGRRIDGGIRRGEWIGRDDRSLWNGHDERDQVSRGRHQLQVRVWDNGGDWVGAWSDSLVTVD